MAPSSKKVQARQVHNRVAADYIAHGPRSLSPALQNLNSEQRLRLAKSSQKVGKVLGEMPIIDVIPSSPGAESVVSTVKSLETRPLNVQKKGGKGKKMVPPPAPVLRYRLPPTRPWDIMEEVIESYMAPPKPIPAALNLASPARTIDPSRLSTFQYGYLKTPLTPEYLSPLTPISPLSPIKTPDIHEHRMQTLRRLARMSRAFRDTIVEELALPSSIGAVATPEVHNVRTYLDLYRMSMCPQRRSQMPHAAGRRRSRSVGDTQRRSVLSVSVYSASTRTSFALPLSADPTRHSHVSYVVAFSSPVQEEGSPTPRALHDDSPLQQQQSVAQAKAVILGADAHVMASFRRGFALRPLAADARRPLPASPCAGTGAKSPKVPYWVRTAYRARDSAHAAGAARRRRVVASRPPPTPRTMRKERRQGWGGEWRMGKMGAVVEKLKEAEAGVKAEGKTLEAQMESPPVDAAKDHPEPPSEEPLAEVTGEAEVPLAEAGKEEEDSLIAYLQDDSEEVNPYTGIAEGFVVEAI